MALGPLFGQTKFKLVFEGSTKTSCASENLLEKNIYFENKRIYWIDFHPFKLIFFNKTKIKSKTKIIILK